MTENTDLRERLIAMRDALRAEPALAVERVEADTLAEAVNELERAELRVKAEREAHQQEEQAIRAEAQRYREALERIAGGTWNNRPGKDLTAIEFARAALANLRKGEGE